MGLQQFIQDEIFRPQLERHGVLVVYDPDQRYRDLCIAMKADDLAIVDAGASTIEGREAAMQALQQLGQNASRLQGLLVYVPQKAAPVADEDKQRDPYAGLAASGAVFPDSDGDGYESLCLRYKPDHALDIRDLFRNNPNPSFAVIDAIGKGKGWPHLQAALGVESARDILLTLLVPTDQQKKELGSTEAWTTEAKTLCQRVLGVTPTTRAKTWTNFSEALWQLLLFSEFVFDLPVQLPTGLSEMPTAQAGARAVVDDLCQTLRDSLQNQSIYIERAEEIEANLNLRDHCADIQDLGLRDTFPFEERTFFHQSVDALKRDNLERVHDILSRREASVWMARGENQAQWTLLRSAMALVEACDGAALRLPDHSRSQADLFDFYLDTLRDVDRLQREFEQAVASTYDLRPDLETVAVIARGAYRRLQEKVQATFIRHLEKEGWPVAGRLANSDLFDKILAPRLQESGRRVALVLIDALRYELGVELSKQLTKIGQVDLQAACAALPSATLIGMASLLPGAGKGLHLTRADGALMPELDGVALRNVGQRMDVLSKRYGARFKECQLRDFAQKKAKVDKTIEFLVLRSNDMDEAFEHNLDDALSQVATMFNLVQLALKRLRDDDFAEVVIATDHGFYLNAALEAGDVCKKPAGNWLNVHDRLQLGDGVGDAANFVIPTDKLGIRGDFAQAAGPRALVAYRAEQRYFHGGASLQECIVPVLVVRLNEAGTKPSIQRKPTVTINYKRGAKITTRLPVIDVLFDGDLFSQPIDLQIEAQDRKGSVVGELKLGGAVNPATRLLEAAPGQLYSVPLLMDEAYEGKFVIKVMDPYNSTLYAKLELETDYTV